MAKQSEYTQIVLETYNRMYEVAEPSLDFNDYIHTTCNYQDKETGEKIVTGEHLSLKEMHEKGYCIDVPFENHFINRDLCEEIIDEVAKKYKLNKSEKHRLRTQVYLGCAPTFKNKSDEKSGDTCQ